MNTENILTVEELKRNPEAQAWVKRMNDLFFPTSSSERSTAQHTDTLGTHTPQQDKHDVR